MIRHRIRKLEAQLDRCDPAPVAPRRLQTAQDVVDLIQEQVEALRMAPWVATLPKAQTIAVLAGIACKAIEDKNLAARVEMLETVLKRREKPSDET